MPRTAVISVNEFSARLGFETLCPGLGIIEFSSAEIGRPGLQFSGFYEHFAPIRVQVVGNSELYYLHTLPEKELVERMDRFMSFPIPCIVFSRSNIPPNAFIESAKRHNVPVFLSSMRTDSLGHSITNYIARELAPKVLMHGMMLDIFGVGILLRGPSGIGKSEMALELIKMGHRLVADDVVEIAKVAPTRLSARAPEATRHLIEVRGIGILDVRHLYGVGAITLEKTIDMIIDLELWDATAQYERIGEKERFAQILDVDIPATRMPVSPGRNIAIVVEVAARHYRLKKTGYSPRNIFDTIHQLDG